MSTAKAVLAAGMGISVVHLIESAYDLGASKSPADKPAVSIDAGLGATASVFSIIQTSAIFYGKFRVAQTVSVFSLFFAASQLLIGGIAYSEKEPGHNGTDLLLAGLQVAVAVSGFSYARFSLPALVAMAKGGDDQALTKLYMRWYGKKDQKAAEALSRIAVANPYRFAANHSAVLFSNTVDNGSARIVLNKLLNSHPGQHIISAPLLGVAIESRPALFNASDIPNLLGQLRRSDRGPEFLDRLITSRPDLGREVLNKSGLVFRRDDWEKFGDSLRRIWVRNLEEENRRTLLVSWKDRLLNQASNQCIDPVLLVPVYHVNSRSAREIWKVVDRGGYDRFLDEFIRTKDYYSEKVAETPLLEDVVLYFQSVPGGFGGVQRIGLKVCDRSDVDISVFDFLWSNPDQKGLRERVLKLFADRASEPHIMQAEAPIMSVTVGEVRQMFGTQVLRGWFDSGDVLIQQNLPALMAVLKEPGYAGNPVLRAIARLHRLGVS
ncbi:MAG: hypothetical protein HYT76_04455 [Deltaproteobacteria bacterium]|nr:hypothetical protein [Deltaproteobacteria bacterium]